MSHLDAFVAVALAAPPPAAPPAAVAAAAAAPQRLTEEQRWHIIIGVTKFGKTQKWMAEQVGCKEHTAGEVMQRYRQTGSPASGSRSGRKRKATDEQRAAIVAASRAQPFHTPRDLRKALDLAGKLSARTISRTLQQAGLFGRVAQEKRDYTPEQLRARLSFANGYSRQDWTKVLFSDEKIFWGRGHNGRVWVRRPVAAAYDPRYTIHKESHPIKVNVLATFAASGLGFICIFQDKLDGAGMKEFLRKNLIAAARTHFSFDPPEEWWLLHDNGPTFTARVTQDYLHNAGVKCMEFPPCSPDLNPIENLWAIFASAVEQYQSETVEELKAVIEQEWKNLDKDTMRKLALSMQNRCAEVIAAQGAQTRY